MAGKFTLMEAFVELKAKGIDTTMKGLDGAKKKTGGLIGAFGKLGQAGLFLGQLKSIFMGIGRTIGGVISKVLQLSKTFLELYGVQQDAEVRLAAVIKGTGGAAGLTAKEMFEYAAALQKVTRFGDEVTLQAAAVQATFKSLKGDTFKVALATAQDISSIMQTDMKAAVLQLSKALEDPARNLTTLNRAGISFTEEQTRGAKALVEAGKQEVAQAGILNVIRKQSGPVAEALAKTFAGRVAQIKNEIGDLGEKLGEALAPAALNIAEAFKGVSRFLEHNIGVTDAWSTALGKITKPIATFGKLLQVDFSIAIEFAKASFKDLFDNLLDQFGKLGVEGGKVLWKGIKAAGAAAFRTQTTPLQQIRDPVARAAAEKNTADITGGIVDSASKRDNWKQFREAMKKAGFQNMDEVFDELGEKVEKSPVPELPDVDLEVFDPGSKVAKAAKGKAEKVGTFGAVGTSDLQNKLIAAVQKKDTTMEKLQEETRDGVDETVGQLAAMNRDGLKIQGGVAFA